MHFPLIASGLLTGLLLAGCSDFSPSDDADVIVVGAGIAGLSAALEASAQNATVLIIEANSVGGGHAVKAGGFALVDTALQRQKGIADSPDLAWRDLQRWGQDPDPYWTRRYAEESGSEVYDWLTSLGVNFRIVLNTPEDSVPRFHFTSGTAVHAIMPMLRNALADPNIKFLWNTRVTQLTSSDNRIIGVRTVNERTGDKTHFLSASVILSTGGFQNNLDMVRDYWPDPQPPTEIYKGAGHFATGDGYELAANAGAELQRMTKQVTFFAGVPNPRDPAGNTAFFAQNPAAIWLDSHGRRFVDESADSKTVAAAVRQLETMSYWMVFDAVGSRKFNLRGSPWITQSSIRDEFLGNPEISHQATSISELAATTGLPEHGLRASIQVWNRMLDLGADHQFARFDTNHQQRNLQKIITPPFYAVKLYPLTRKSMGGPAISKRAQVLNKTGQPITGLYAAGELTGVAGINGSHGGSGTFLGPSVLTGRIAGRNAALSSSKSTALRPAKSTINEQITTGYGKPGYWHYDAVHRTVSEREYTCEVCHNEQMPMRMVERPVEMITRLNTCTNCH